MHYRFSNLQPASRLIDITATWQNTSGNNPVCFQLPAWRPGRYELGNFAKNIQRISFSDGKGHLLSAKKLSAHTWQVEFTSAAEIVINYTVYAAELNAGSTFADDKQLYVNPVNCLLYEINSIDEPCAISFDLPWKNARYAVPLPKKDDTWYAKSFHELADSPFIVSPHLTELAFTVAEIPVHIWFMGECKPNVNRIQQDFTRYMEFQIRKFGDCPSQEYHYLVQVLPHTFYHGVEHVNSTVIALGPGYDLMHGRYDEFLGVSCHEFYHVWNIKSIRPAEMHPYDYTRENYFETGYVAEGVTTYMGDLILWQSGVFGDDEFYREINAQLQKHADNPGRHNYSVAQSSFDTWLDGYVPGVSGRKVSIYTEGCLLALCADLLIRKNTNDTRSLHDAMRMLYEKTYKKGKGYSADDYRKILEEISGLDFGKYFTEYVNGTANYFDLLRSCLSHVGLEIGFFPAENYYERVLGMKIQENGDHALVQSVYPGSPAAHALRSGQKIIAVNGYTLNNDAAKKMQYFSADTLRLTIHTGQRLEEIELRENQNEYYTQARLKVSENATAATRKSFAAWKKG